MAPRRRFPRKRNPPQSQLPPRQMVVTAILRRPASASDSTPGTQNESPVPVYALKNLDSMTYDSILTAPLPTSKPVLPPTPKLSPIAPSGDLPDLEALSLTDPIVPTDPGITTLTGWRFGCSSFVPSPMTYHGLNLGVPGYDLYGYPRSFYPWGPTYERVPADDYEDEEDGVIPNSWKFNEDGDELLIKGASIVSNERKDVSAWEETPMVPVIGDGHKKLVDWDNSVPEGERTQQKRQRSFAEIVAKSDPGWNENVHVPGSSQGKDREKRSYLDGEITGSSDTRFRGRNSGTENADTHRKNRQRWETNRKHSDRRKRIGNP